MIVLLGTRTGHLKTLKIAGRCRKCLGNESVELIIDQRVVHIFWIPIFPTRKIFTSECYQCRDLLMEPEIANLYPLTYNEAKKKISSPFWAFTGIALIFFSILLIGTLGYFRKMKEQFLIQTPRPGDIYQYESGEQEYSLLKVSEARGDTVYVFTNSYSAMGRPSMRRLMDRSRFNFSKEATPKLRSELIQMFEDGAITGVKRE
jgi:hypothetical protein